MAEVSNLGGRTARAQGWPLTSM